MKEIWNIYECNLVHGESIIASLIPLYLYIHLFISLNLPHLSAQYNSKMSIVNLTIFNILYNHSWSLSLYIYLFCLSLSLDNTLTSLRFNLAAVPILTMTLIIPSTYPVQRDSHLAVVPKNDELAVVHDWILLHYLRRAICFLHLLRWNKEVMKTGKHE